MAASKSTTVDFNRMSTHKNIIISAANKKKKVVRNVLCAPNVKKWPVIEPEDEHVLLDTIKNVITPLNINKLREIQYPEELRTRKEKNELKKKTRLEHWAEGKEKRSWLVFGINEVTKCLEKDQLCAILVARDVTPTMMTQHLIPLSETRKVIAVSILQLKTTLNDVLNLRSCIALGLKKGVDDPANLFHQIYSVLKSIKIPSPRFDTKSPTKPLIPMEITPVIKETQKSKVEKTPVDVKQFYVFKSDGKFVPKTAKEPKKIGVDFLNLGEPDAVNVRDELYKMADIRQIESFAKPPKKKRKR